MKAILFGASGMVGQGVLRELLLDTEVTEVVVVVRAPLGRNETKLSEIVHRDFFDFSSIEDSLRGYDACFFCLGVSSLGMKEADYYRLTYDLTMAAAKTMAKLNPAMSFLYITGAGTDSTEAGSVMWARVKGKTENALSRLFPAAYMFRPGFIQALHGIESKTAAYRIPYLLITPFIPLLKRLSPASITTTEELGRVMIHVAKTHPAKHIFEMRDIVGAK